MPGRHILVYVYQLHEKEGGGCSMWTSGYWNCRGQWFDVHVCRYKDHLHFGSIRPEQWQRCVEIFVPHAKVKGKLKWYEEEAAAKMFDYTLRPGQDTWNPKRHWQQAGWVGQWG